MAMTYLTKLKPEPMGEYSLSTTYGVNSLVMSGDGAAAYISVKDVPAGTPLTNTDYWKKHTDLTAVKQSAEAAAQKANAARDDMLEIARNLTDMVEKSGNPVQAELVGGLPFDRVATALSPIQSGSGDPSPSNIRQISGWTGAKLTRCGKNMLKNTATSQTTNGVTFTVNADGSVTVNGTATANAYFVVGKLTLSAGSYIVSGCPANGSSSKYFVYADHSGGKSDYGSGGAFTLADTKEVIATIAVRSGITVSNLTFYPMIRLASITDDTFEPYQGDIYTVDFGQTVYGGTLDWQTGVLTADRAMITLSGAENYTYVNGWQSGCCVIYGSSLPGAVKIQGYATVAELVCSHATANTVEKISGTAGIVGVGQNDDNLYISLGTQDKDSLVAYISAQYSAGTPVQICYKLATPTTIQLTPQEIKQLQGVNTLYGDGSISMTGRADKALALEARIAALESAG